MSFFAELIIPVTPIITKNTDNIKGGIHFIIFSPLAASMLNDIIARIPTTVSITERIRLSLLFILAPIILVDYLEPRHIFYTVDFVLGAYLGESDSVGYKILVPG